MNLKDIPLKTLLYYIDRVDYDIRCEDLYKIQVQTV